MFYKDGLTELSILKESPRQTVSVVCDKTGTKYIKRVFDDDRREIYKMLMKITCPSIPKIHSLDFDGNTTVIEQYIEGETLSERLDKGYTFTKKSINRIIKDILSAVGALHDADIIHRDIKPDNIIITSNDRAYLCDFDISRIYRNDFRRDTETLGTFGYAPIEQYGMMPTDFKTDIYAFGVTLKELLERSGVKKGYLHKIADKCKRLDPEERFKSIQNIKKSIVRARLLPVGIFVSVIVLLSIISAIIFAMSNQKNLPDAADERDEDYYYNDEPLDRSDDQYSHLLRFYNSEIDGSYEYTDYSVYKNVDTTSIFSGEEEWDYIPIMQDMRFTGNVLLGKKQRTVADYTAELADGVFTISLSDSFGNSFEHEFSLEDEDFEILYSKNRRVNAELMCRDLDGDGVEELLVGLCDCSMTTDKDSIYLYFNYSEGYAIKYNESGGFMLCEGKMISEGAKFAFIENDLRVHLPVYARNTNKCDGYILKNNKLFEFTV